MARIGFLYLPWTGHLNPLAGLGYELSRRGHEVAFFHLPEFEDDARDRGLHFVPFGVPLKPKAKTQAREMARLEGLEAMICALKITRILGQSTLQDAGPVVREWKPDLLVIDQLDYAGSTLAQLLGLPFVTAAVTLLKQDEEGIPGFDGQPYRAAEAKPRPAPLVGFLEDLDRARKAGGLSGFSYQTLWSTLAQISQQPPEFEFPRKALPDCFHFTGPFAADRSAAPRPHAEFPWHRLDDRPLIYVSLGTVTSAPSLLETIVKATRDLEVQLVVAAKEALTLPPSDVVQVGSAPQLEVLSRARVMITHAGMNSTLEALAAGVPMLALPMSHDQPGIACRIVWSGTGLALQPEQRQAYHLRTALRELLNKPTYRESALTLKRAIARNQGLSKAADIVESVALKESSRQA